MGFFRSSRLSIISTVIYFLPSGRNRSITCYSFTGLCLAYLAALVSKIFYNGAPVPLVPSAPFSRVAVLINLTLNIAATLWLVGWPAYILVRMKLRKPHRRLFIVCFSCTLLLAAMDVFHALNIIVERFDVIMVSAHLELLFSVLTANVVILAAFLYRAFKARQDGAITSLSESDSASGTSERQVAGTTQAAASARAFATARSSEIGPFTTLYMYTTHYSQEGDVPETSQVMLSGGSSKFLTPSSDMSATTRNHGRSIVLSDSFTSCGEHLATSSSGSPSGKGP
ncbi:hypothetical protein CC1G_09279 [Coprinopsis cinerea okayama7|uniref:Integral membrane protein n=1 Tax=Coprinopsis cinerea (strain Okayama-7 / 130 / ATCC MYA-4618 / FGSC 9003) TaxID=240176 RepID=A8N858_COPC7|nr:hypothetical protein CC1G_09279 [Coprinopsis cinerea okayama7\|eukprot:XP_001831014.2 hypothetical protein CC1G_09279 [Coprinopsis cinerea okayama7\